MPAETGNGLAMRAAMVLRLLARRYDVSLLVVPLYASPAPMNPAALGALCRDVVVEPLWERGPLARPPPGRIMSIVSNLSTGGAGPGPHSPGTGRWPAVPERFDVAHIFRLAALPFARPWLDADDAGVERQLDLDDVESATRRRIAALYRENGNAAAADAEELEATRSEMIEDEILTTFDRVYVCSESDRRALLGRASAQVCVLPNALSVPQPMAPMGSGLFTFLFVGTLGYYPNADGLRFFCNEVVPLLRRIAPGEFRVAIVGGGAGEAIRQLVSIDEVQLVGAAPDIRPWYQQAHAVVVPIRAGGGTRIKVIEAFAYRCPVISTSVGVEGIEAGDGEHVLVGDTPAELAEQCARLMIDPTLGRRLADRAFDLFRRTYTLEGAASALDACSSSPGRRGWRSVFGWRGPR